MVLKEPNFDRVMSKRLVWACDSTFNMLVSRKEIDLRQAFDLSKGAKKSKGTFRDITSGILFLGGSSVNDVASCSLSAQPLNL